MGRTHFIQRAIQNPGGLHESVGVPQGKKIPKAKVNAAAKGKYGPKAQKQADLAKTLGKLRKK